MFRSCSWLLCASMCVACAGSEGSSESLSRTEQAVWRGTWGTQANAPGINLAKGGFCSTVLLSSRVGLTAQHCTDLLPVTDSDGTTIYSEILHPLSPLWDDAVSPTITSTWAPSGWKDPDRSRDLRIIAFEGPTSTAAPLTVFPARIRYFDSLRVHSPAYASYVNHSLPVVFMGWGTTETGASGDLNEQWAYSFGNNLTYSVTETDSYRKWTTNLGPFSDYKGPDSGDSGGPLFRQLSASEPAEFELVGLSTGPDKNAKNEDPRYSSEELAKMTAAERAAAYAYNITYHWSDVTHLTFLQELYYRAGDAQRPGRLFGEKDYYGPTRFDLDSDGDHFFGTSNLSCPMYLYDERGVYGELTQAGGVNYAPNLGSALPALHAYRNLYLNDRTRVYARNLTWGTVALGSHEASLLDGPFIGGRIGTDTDVGKLYAEGSGNLALADRSKVRTAWWSGMHLSFGSGVVVANSPESTAMRVPQSRLIKTFPTRYHGTIPSITRIANADYWVGPCTVDAYCHIYQSIEPSNTVNLASGYYGDLSVKSNSKLILRGGDYYFDVLMMESGSSLVVATGASARVWVRDSLTLRNYGNITRVVDPSTKLLKVTDVSAAANLFIGYYGLADVSVWELTGTLLAPYTKVSLETNRSSATAHAGMVIANQIELHQGNSFYHVPYQCR